MHTRTPLIHDTAVAAGMRSVSEGGEESESLPGSELMQAEA